MLNCGRSALICLFFVFSIECTAGFWDFWPFNFNKVATPSVKVIPETDGNFIHIKHFDDSSVQAYIDSKNGFVDTHYPKIPKNGANILSCDFEHPSRPGMYCDFDIRYLHPCTPDNDYNFRKESPCFYFTLSQVLNWTPEVLNSSDISHMASSSFSTIPGNLNASIAEKENSIKKYVWFTCEGETASDEELIGPVSNYPYNGFPTYYFPFTNVEGHRSPIVAVRFERPTRGVVINIICKAWAKNIAVDEEKGLGFVKFHLRMD